MKLFRHTIPIVMGMLLRIVKQAEARVTCTRCMIDGHLYVFARLSAPSSKVAMIPESEPTTPLYQNFNGIFMDSRMMANGCIKYTLL